MRAEDVIIAELHELRTQVKVLTAAMWGAPEWFTLQAACKYKGVNYNTVKTDRRLQPQFGRPDKLVGTRKYWSRETIVEWSQVMDSVDLIKYEKDHPLEAAMI